MPGGADDGGDHDVWHGLFDRGAGAEFVPPAICSAIPQSLSRPPTAPSHDIAQAFARSLPVLAIARDRDRCGLSTSVAFL